MKNRILIVFSTALLLCSACQREVKPFLGDYSYKLSGEIAITDTDGTISYHFIHRNGQMNILQEKSQSNRLTITLNEMNGGCYTLSATVKGDSLLLDPHEFNMNILTQEGSSIFDSDNTSSLVYRITASGCGIRNDKMLMLDEAWSGHQSGNESIAISGPEMKIIAEKN